MVGSFEHKPPVIVVLLYYWKVREKGNRREGIVEKIEKGEI